MNPLIPAFLQGVWGLGKQYFDNKKEEKQVKHKQKLKLLEQDATLISQGENSWKDEWWVVVLSLPLIQLMLAPAIELYISEAPYVNGQWTEAVISGLEGLHSAPEWYQYGLGISILYSFGVKPTAKNVANFIKKRG